MAFHPIAADDDDCSGVGVARKYAWIVFALTFGLLISDYMSRQVLNAVFPMLKGEWALSDGQLGLLSGIVALMVGLLTIPLSLLADRFGRVKSLALMALLWSLATLGCALAQDYQQMFIARFMVGVGEAAYGSVGIAVVISVFGIREGLLCTMLSEEERRKDPLLAACDDLARRRSRSIDSAYELCFWTDALFRAPGPTETPEQRRLRHAACLLSDIGWHAHPDYRGIQSLNLVAHGNFVGVDHPGRAFLALSVYYRNEGTLKNELSQSLIELVDKEMLKRARILGAAFRAAHMVSASMPGVLTNTPIGYEGNRLVWTLPDPYSNLEGERVDRRFKVLADLLGREAEIRVGPSFQLAAS